MSETTTLSWIAEHALALWLLLLAATLLVADRLWWRAAQRRQRRIEAGQLLRVMQPLTTLALVLALVLVFAAVALAVSRGHDGLTRLDSSLAEQLRASMSPAFLAGVAWLTQLGNPWALAAISGLIALGLWWRGHRALALNWLVALAGTAVINRLLKAIFQRTRPIHEHGLVSESSYSFPSGHASGAIVFYGMLAYVLLQLLPARLHRPVIAAMTAAITVIGISRILLQVHYFSDVLAGYLSGLAWLLLCIGWAEYQRLRALSPLPG